MKICRVFRPTLDDVERLSQGKGARRRGTGSKYVCHRLNRDERRIYDIAKEAGYLSCKGSSYRQERKGSPLRNTFRQRCDALEQMCVIIEKRSAQDRILIDFSTLRLKDDSAIITKFIEEVIKGKYPDLYHSTRVLCEEQNINWKKVQTSPIWDIAERLIIVECDRHVAKTMAVDIICGFSKSFETINYEESVDQIQDTSYPLPKIEKNADDDCCSIDWSDI